MKNQTKAAPVLAEINPVSRPLASQIAPVSATRVNLAAALKHAEAIETEFPGTVVVRGVPGRGFVASPAPAGIYPGNWEWVPNRVIARVEGQAVDVCFIKQHDLLDDAEQSRITATGKAIAALPEMIAALRSAQEHLASYRTYSDEMSKSGRGHEPSSQFSPDYLASLISAALSRLA